MAKMIEIIIAYSLFITVVGARTLSEKAKDFEEELERFLKDNAKSSISSTSDKENKYQFIPEYSGEMNEAHIGQAKEDGSGENQSHGKTIPCGKVPLCRQRKPACRKPGRCPKTIYGGQERKLTDQLGANYIMRKFSRVN